MLRAANQSSETHRTTLRDNPIDPLALRTDEAGLILSSLEERVSCSLEERVVHKQDMRVAISCQRISIKAFIQLLNIFGRDPVVFLHEHYKLTFRHGQQKVDIRNPMETTALPMPLHSGARVP
mmetsp:Transcript_13431/g.36926  ORF Transcript_13431/g.36926 Transcript_13431/m.36926 type:complete len:123 (-) Transcript_13431:90-458(-)